MKIKLDENIPTRLVNILSKLGHTVDTVIQEGLKGQEDLFVWQAAQREEYFLITQDLDFSDTHLFMTGTHHGLLLVRLRNPGRDAMVKRFEAVVKSENIENWKGCFVTMTENKIRVRRPRK